MKHYQITLESRTFDVKVLDDPRQEQVRVQVDGETFTVGVKAVSSVAEVSSALVAAASTPQAVVATASGQITAPLPGVIKTIAVRPGQQVAANDEVLVIEAMKMDNVIRAPRAGVVAMVHVAEGRQVAYGAPLLDLD
jgi:biotin carboxyl carrier protein